MEFKTFAVVASKHEEAQKAEAEIKAKYEHVPPEEADIVVALGGDGFMLQTLHSFMEQRKPIFGMNRGSVGFLMNQYESCDLRDRLARADAIDLKPVRMTVIDTSGVRHEALGINEVSVLRDTRFAAKIRIHVDGIVRMDEMICDGVLVSTPAGSTAYNNAVHGPILPLDAELLALTPISAFRPRNWRGALLPNSAAVRFEVLQHEKRPVSAVADSTEVRDIVRVDVVEDRRRAALILFDPEHNLEERILNEQFQH
ncbi:MAG: NAD kinase [Rhodospirillales bacterium]|nr:NAD kinase [Rhodospirillales bacterium]